MKIRFKQLHKIRTKVQNERDRIGDLANEHNVVEFYEAAMLLQVAQDCIEKAEDRLLVEVGRQAWSK